MISNTRCSYYLTRTFELQYYQNVNCNASGNVKLISIWCTPHICSDFAPPFFFARMSFDFRCIWFTINRMKRRKCIPIFRSLCWESVQNSIFTSRYEFLIFVRYRKFPKYINSRIEKNVRETPVVFGNWASFYCINGLIVIFFRIYHNLLVLIL